MKKTIVSLSILIALLMSLFQPSAAPDAGNGSVNTCDLISSDYPIIEAFPSNE